MTDKKHLVSFLDILGYRSHVKNFLNGDRDILDNIKEAIEYSSIDFGSEDLEKIGLKIQMNQFSDCTCMSLYDDALQDPEDELFIPVLFIFLDRIRFFQNSMLESDVYIRGGISSGFHYENKNMIFSEGLIKSYDLELEASYPRVLLDENIAETLKELFKTDKKDTIISYGMEKILITSFDEQVFINPFNLHQSMEEMVFAREFIDTKNTPRGRGIKKMLKEDDLEYQSKILNNVESKIETLKSGPKKILEKYNWLREFIKWNQDPKSSKIEFEYYLK